MNPTVDTPTKAKKNRVAAGITTRSAPPLWWALLQLGAFGFHIPLSILTGSQSSLASTSSVLGIGSLVSLGGVALYLILGRFMSAKWGALAVASVTVIFFWHWSAGTGVGPIGALVLFAVVVTAAIKFSSNHYLKVVAFVTSVTLSTTAGVLAIADSQSAPEQTTGVQDPIGHITLTSHPDIVLVVLDGYGRDDVMRDVYEFDNSRFLDDLRNRGFDVASRSVANYSITHLSIPALLNMSYVHPEGGIIGNADLAYLADEVSGSNDFVGLLRSEGYEYIHGEGDHWINQCGEAVDLCLPGPPLDITGWALLQRTPIGSLFFRKTGDPTTHLNVERIANLRDWSNTISSVASPSFAFLHIQLPHPPLFLDSACSVRIEPHLDGRVLNDGAVAPERMAQRKQAWIEQVECANATILEFIGSLDPESVVVLASDHGPDSVYRFEPDASDLTKTQLYERYSTLTAVRLPESCRRTLPDDIDTVNIFRVVLSCLSGDEIPVLETRSYLGGFGGPIQEVELPAENADE